jgi:N-acetylglucosaminyldiphosphoundecaprenol N-acetyl-beta-D-mannosaminyltransferase
MAGTVCFKLLGVELTPLNIAELHGVISKTIREGGRRIIANHNLHSIYLHHHDSKMRLFYGKADYAHIDGMALVFLGRLLGHDLVREQRVTYVDWIRPLAAEAAANNWRIFYVGSKPGVAESASELLIRDFPGLSIATLHGYFDPDPLKTENSELMSRINDFQPQILMVGMGMPRQEHWILDNLEKIQANVILPAGACFDYVAGVVPTSPRWMGRVGLEWLFRLFNEPHRLWRRYLIEPWFILKLLLREVIR